MEVISFFYGDIMVILRLKINNFLLFNNFEIDMSYPKKILHSSIPEEHLKGYPNFRYKKLIVLMGANASGKTALGRILMSFCNFISRKEYGNIVEYVEDKAEKASFEMDFAEDGVLYRFKTLIDPMSENSYTSKNIHVTVDSVKIRKSDKYESAKILLDQACKVHIPRDNYIEELESIPRLTWMYTFSVEAEGGRSVVDPMDQDVYAAYLKKILCVLDPRIKNVSKSLEMDNSYVIERKFDKIFIQNGTLNEKEKLSSGTQEGIAVANLFATMSLHGCSFYYCDEKFSHIHSDFEKAFLSVLIDALGDDEQLFFTTHNSDVLEMDLPLHAYAFLRRDRFEEDRISCVYASDFIKKNDVSLRAAVENDIFSAVPDVSSVFSLME